MIFCSQFMESASILKQARLIGAPGSRDWRVPYLYGVVSMEIKG
jgi:hypothetical protein